MTRREQLDHLRKEVERLEEQIETARRLGDRSDVEDLTGALQDIQEKLRRAMGQSQKGNRK
jgi:hypothetical protein